MTSWRIWNILHNPPFGHPLFRRVLLRQNHAGRKKQPRQFILFDARFIIELLAALFICAAMFSPIFMLLIIIGVFLLMNGTLYGMFWAVKASGIIARERTGGAYDLYCMAPEGALGVNWAICAGCLHFNKRLEHIHKLVRSLLGIGLATIMLILLIVAFSILQGGPHTTQPEATYRSSLMLIQVTALLGIFYIDHIHSIVLSSVVSILVPTYTQGRLDAQLGTVGIYIFLQVAAYVTAYMVCLLLLPALYSGMTGLGAQMSLAALQVVAFYGIREAIITLLWHRMVKQLNITPVEENVILRPAEALGLKP